MTTTPTKTLSTLLLLAALPACSGAADASGGGFTGGETSGPEYSTGTGLGDGDGDNATSPGDGDGDPGEGDGDGEPDPGDGDGDGDSDCLLDCGLGTCVLVGAQPYCECPEETAWRPQACDPCPTVDADGHVVEVAYVEFSGNFRVGDVAPPKSQYDDANVWLENLVTGDRVLLGNTHDEQFGVRVTPGIYTLVYELETPGDVLPHNPRAPLGRVALFEPLVDDVQIPTTRVSGAITLNGMAPPADQYDDAQLLFRHVETGDEVVAGNTHDGSYEVALVPGNYELVYRSETPGELVPHNDGAVLGTVPLISAEETYPIDIPSVVMAGDFMLNGVAPPASQYDDANVALDSDTLGHVALGNTHDGSYAVPVIPGSYTLVYMHETGSAVPQNRRARFGPVEADGQPKAIDIPMVTLSGLLTINGEMPPGSQYDDGTVHLRGEGDDIVPLGNTHDGAYQVNVIPGTYDVIYAQETAGGTVPENKGARVRTGAIVDEGSTNLDIDIEAVAISGSITLGGQLPPSSVYEDGRIYLRNDETGDSVVLGSTHQGSYAAVVVPGDYELFYVQEAGGDVPGNQNAALFGVAIGGAMALDVDVPVVDLNGQFTRGDGSSVPNSAEDGGQLILRDVNGDSALLGDSFASSFAARLVAGTYGIYYRAEGSMTMPQNSNGRLSCITVE